MQCLFLFRDSSGRLPTAQDLRRCGFKVSEAVLQAEETLGMDEPALHAQTADARRSCGPALALAAEPRPAYGVRDETESRPARAGA